LVTKPLEEDHTPGTVKPVQVSLVKPVAYHFQLGRSDFRVTVPALDEMEIVKTNYFAG
jgi:hypothetical protein